MGIARPAILFTMWAVCWDPLQVAQISPLARPPDFVEQRIRAFEFADGRNIRMNKNAADIFQSWPARKSSHFDVLKPVISETRNRMCRAIEDIRIGLKLLIRIELEDVFLNLIAIEPPGFVQTLAVIEHDLYSNRTARI